MLAIVLRVVGAYTGALGVHAGFGTVGAHAQALVVMDVWCVVCVCVFAGRVCGLSSLVDVWCVLAERVWPCGYVVCLLAEWLWFSGCALPGLSQLYATLYSGTKSCPKNKLWSVVADS